MRADCGMPRRAVAPQSPEPGVRARRHAHASHVSRVVAALAGALLLAPVIGWGAYAGVTWLTFGRRGAPADTDSLMDRYAPRADVAEVHRTRVAAPPALAYDAALRMDLYQAPVVRAIFRG